MYGLGVSPLDLWGNFPSSSTCHRLVMEQKAVVSKLEEKLAMQAKDFADMKAMMMEQRNSGSTSESVVQYRSSPNISPSTVGTRVLKEGDQVDIISLIDSSKVVAIGCLQGMDPSNFVGGYRLGLGWYEILMQVVKAFQEQLIRPYSPMETIGDALGAPIAWPSKLVKFHFR